MNRGGYMISVFILVLILLGFVIPLFNHQLTDTNYLLTVLAAAGTLGGIAFAIYGWFSTKELPKLIDTHVHARVQSAMDDLNRRLVKQQEAMQKVIASYQIRDPDQKIALLKQAIDLDPSVYNAYVSLGYVYWYEKDDFMSAEQCFQKDLEYHPDNYQAASDLAALYAHYSQTLSALSWIRKALELNPRAWESFETDSRLAVVRGNHPDAFRQVIDEARNKTM